MKHCPIYESSDSAPVGKAEMSSGDYTAIPSTGKLKLKGVKDSKIDKKKRKKKAAPAGDDGKQEFEDRSVMLKQLEDEDKQITKEDHRKMGVVDGKEVAPGAGAEDEETATRLKTEAERRYEEQRRKRVRLEIILSFVIPANF